MRRVAALGPPCQQGAPLQASWSAVSLQLRFGSVDVNTGTRLLQTDTAGVDMSKLELLGAFLNERLTAAAEEILGAVKEAVEEYQSEILRSQEENERLKGLLHAAVQRLLLQPGEPGPPPVPLQEDIQARDSEWRSREDLVLLHVKEEPKPRHMQTDLEQELEKTHSEEQSLHPASAQRVSPPPLTSMELKKEDSEENRVKLHASSSSSSPAKVPLDCSRAAQIGTGLTSTKSRRPPKTGPLLKGLKPSVLTMPIKNGRPLKLPRPSQPGQSIQRWHSCSECGKSFSFACQLEVHTRWHTKEKPYGCGVCRKSFTTVSMLKRHHRIHTGEKPFRCHVCGKCFNQSAHLNTHFRLHTRDRAGRGRPPQ
uniref:C2H2-type domain-containing protein n=2 Tax=Oryzias latipes TaxID=8090 RepID=A0A3B3I8F3_ORYLA